MDAHTAAVLQRVVERERSSLLQYAHDSYPWTTPDRPEVLAKLRTIVDWESRRLTPLVRFMQAHRLPLPTGGRFPTDFTTINYIALNHLLPLLEDDERRSAQALEEDIQSVTDPAARAVLAPLLEAKHRHVAELQSLVGTEPAAIRT